MSYAALVEHSRNLFRLRHVDALASWDEAVMMPAGGEEARADALAMLRGLIHQRATDKRLSDLFGAARAEVQRLSPWQLANLRLMEREWLRATALPQDLVEAMSLAESRCEQAWRKLRPANDFAGFLPLFTEVVRLKREAAQALGQKLGLNPYDALLDEFEPGERSASIAPLFARLRAFLPGIIEKAVERQATEQVATSQGPFPLERQQSLASEILRIVGFDFNRGRLDLAPHPFCSSIPTDVRITARFGPDDYVDGLMIVLHESGHGRYQQGLPSDWLDQPVGAARSTCLHEGQAIFTEMQLGRSRAFLEFLAPLIAKAFPDAAARDPRAFEPDNLFRQLSRVKPGLIRVAADAATYPCHVVLRFELEQALIDGSLMPADLPEAWNKGMREMLGFETLGNYRDGCMQDLHWPCGMFGYFPTYTVGALMAAQLFAAINRACPDLEQHIRRGELAPLNSWLREHVWSQGSVESGMALVARATGQPLSTEAFEQHLKRRYLLREA